MGHANLDKFKKGIRYDTDKTKTKTKGGGSHQIILKHVSIDMVDKVAVKLGYHISDIYPDYYDWE